MGKIAGQRITNSDIFTSETKAKENYELIQHENVNKKANTPITVCVPWEQKRKELDGEIENEEILRRVWQDSESLAHMFIWHCLVSF